MSSDPKAPAENGEQESKAGCGVCCPPDADVLGLKKYDYKWLCLPQVPFMSVGLKPPMFLSKDEKLPLLLAIIMGLQHALAMIAGIATSGGLLISGDACFDWQKDSAMCESKSYLVSVAWITSGLLTIVQVFRARILKTKYYLGTGLTSVMGTSFTFLPIAREMVVGAIQDAKLIDGRCVDGDCKEAGFEGYGRFLGTCMVASFLEVLLAMLPPRVIKKFFPPVVTGSAVMLIGGGLIASGIKYLGGGVFCADNMASKEAAFGFGPHLCNENGDVVLAFGAPQYIGLGVTVVFFTTFIQFFGSPFLKSTSLFWGFLFGAFCSGVASYTAVAGDKTVCSAEPDVPCIGGYANAVVGKSYGYWNNDRIEDAPAFTFLWNNDPNPLGFLGFSPEYFLPIIIGFFISTAETVGDIGASCHASGIPSVGDDFDSRVQGGLLADGMNSFLAAIFTSPPNTTFSQNNGIIALTRCASRATGFACAVWLILFGVLGKFGAIFSSVPICVVGGMVLMCFSMVFVSGIKIVSTQPISRRNSFILTLALGFGMGVAMIPHLFDASGGQSFYGNNLAHSYGFWPLRDACETFPKSSDFGATDLVKARGRTSAASCVVPVVGDSTFTCGSCSQADCEGLGGSYTAAVYEPVFVETCIQTNGACCKKYDVVKKMWRTTVVMILKTPYCIGFLIAAMLNVLLPEDSEDPDFVTKQLPAEEF
mmetsp:Transcript_116991/g.331065  ORF Transcript_116991/g.331065 Transcript_116991/m.331065 type:complete len:706 (+) Transcript_116991:59-2176(+)